MGRRKREDEPGALHHIFNRGIARRTVFESRDDVRFFLSRLAREHRRDRLRVHAYVIRPNHFHLLVSSPRGQISEAMRVIQNEYVRRFNRMRGRDGPLFRGRFGSRRVMSEAYWWTLLRYIDRHSLCKGDGGVYPYGSAHHYLTDAGPRWLYRARVEELLLRGSGLERFHPRLYERHLLRPLAPAERELVEQRMRQGQSGEDPLDELLTAGPPEIRALMVRRAAMADGTQPGLAVVSPTRLVQEIALRSRREPDWHQKPSRKKQVAWPLLQVGLLRDGCGLTFAEIASRANVPLSCARSKYMAHRALLLRGEEYAERASRVLAACLAALQRTNPA